MSQAPSPASFPVIVSFPCTLLLIIAESLMSLCAPKEYKGHYNKETKKKLTSKGHMMDKPSFGLFPFVPVVYHGINISRL